VDVVAVGRELRGREAAVERGDPLGSRRPSGRRRAVNRVALGLLAAALTAQLGCGGGDGAPERYRVLVFTKTTGFRHPSIPAGVEAIRRLGERHGFGVDHTEEPFEDLEGYAAVVFLSTTGEPLAEGAPRRALQRHIRRGGGFLGVHAASDAFYGWRWYAGLVGASFREHAPGTPPATVLVEDRSSPATRGLPAAWRRRDEWYAFRANPRPAVHVLLTLDERSYEPGGAVMGRDHPLAWCHRYDGGRSVYTAMGHTSESYAEPRFLAHLLGSIRMAAGRGPFACAPRT
jgi:type 1 glutamine amidotransferase